MKLIIFGATGKTGQHIWRQALAQGHEVTVFVRSIEKINSTDQNLRVTQGDVFDTDRVAQALAGQDAAIVALGSKSLGDKTTLTLGTKSVLEGVARHSVRRLIILSAAGVGESKTQVSWPVRLLFRTILRNIHADHVAQEALVSKSSLDWTIVRAAILKDALATGAYTVTNTGQLRHINRADLANFMVKQLTDTSYRQQAISITS